MTHQDVSQLGIAVHYAVQGKDGPAGKTEHHIHAFLEQALTNEFRTGESHESPLAVSWRRPYSEAPFFFCTKEKPVPEGTGISAARYHPSFLLSTRTKEEEENNSMTVNGVGRRTLLHSGGSLPGEFGALLPPASH